MKLTALVVAYFLAGSLALFAASALTPWEALKHLPKKSVYTVLNRDGSCYTGSFVSVSESAFVLDQNGEKSLPKAEIVRISSGETPDVHTTVYSARSSWADVLALQSPPHYSSLLLVTTDDRQFTGALIGVSNEQITLMVDTKEMRFAKDFLARVLLTGKKPAFDGSGPHWNPIYYSKKIVAPTQPIPLYEVKLGEDNSPLECAPAYRRRPQ